MPIRKRMVRRDEPGSIRFITASCEHRLPLFKNNAIKAVFVESLVAAREKHGFELFAWVLMPEHFHLLIRTPSNPSGRGQMPLALMLVSIKQGVSQRVLPHWKKMNAGILPKITRPDGTVKFWQSGGGFDRNVRDMEEFCKEVRYIHRNPVDRGLVERPQDWQWSSVRWWMGHRDGELPCDPPPSDRVAWDRWQGFM
jgi:putative transposase